MGEHNPSDESRDDDLSTATKDSPEGDAVSEKGVVNEGKEARNDEPRPFGRRTVLKLAGATLAAGSIAAVNPVGTAGASRDVSKGDGYEVWTIRGKEVYDLSNGETLENVLVDQTADGACLTIRSRNKRGWVVRNVGFLGVGQAGSGGNRFQFQVSCPDGGNGLIENVWANGKARDGQPSTELGGIYIRSSHAGHIDIRHTYIEGFGNNAVYASAVGKDGGSDGSVALENCYHRDNTVSQYRIGSPGTSVRNCVGIVDDPNGERGAYPGGNNRNARGVWGKHFRDQRFENCSFYVSPNDFRPDGVFEARYISGRSHGREAVAEVVDCNVNPDSPTLTGTTSNARVNFTNLGENPTVTVIQGGGVPLSPEMAALGDRGMPPEIPGASGGDSGGSSDDGPTLERTLAVDGTDAGWTDYTVTVSGDLEKDADLGSVNDGDVLDGSTATGFVNGGTDGFRFSGEVVDCDVDGDATVLVDGAAVDPDSFGDPDPTVETAPATGVTDATASLQGSLASLGEAESADVAFQWRAVGDSSWTITASETTSASGAYSRGLTDLSAETTYEYRAVATASDGDVAHGSSVEFTTTEPAPTLDRTLTVDGTDADHTSYQFTVSGEVAENEAVGSLGTGDEIEGSTASGFVNGGTDGYRFSGSVEDVSVDGDATVLVDGVPMDTAPDLPNTLVFDGSGTGSETTYRVDVSGELAGDPTVGSLESVDEVDGGTVSGTVDAGDVDGFRFSGNVTSLRLDGEASVVFEDNDG